MIYELGEARIDEDYLTRWIEAEYEVAGWWPLVEDVATLIGGARIEEEL